MAVVLLAWASSGECSENLTRGLVIAPEALDVVQESSKGEASVSYYVKEAYPAEKTLAFIQERLTSAGWRPILGKNLERYEHSSLEAGWTELPGKRVAVAGRIWSARWIDAQANEVVYTLSYMSPQAEQGMKPTHVSVAAWCRDKATAARVRLWMQSKVDRLKAADPPDR
jgi:hypothetical protein